MIRGLLFAALVALVSWCAFAQQTAAAPPVLPRLFTPYGTFERTPQGWRCDSVGSSLPSLLQELRSGDILTTINGRDLTHATPLGLLQFLRLAEFDLADDAGVTRGDQRLRFAAPQRPQQIIARQDSLEVLHSSYPDIHQGDVLQALNQTTFDAMMSTVTNPLTTVVNIEVRSGKLLHVTRNRQPASIEFDTGGAIRLVQFALDPTQEPPSSTVLEGITGRHISLSSLRGRWILLHFWASWCAPCIRHMPDIRELTANKDLFVAAVGFADSPERLKSAASREPGLKVFAPNLPLQRDLAVTGIPFEALIDPTGRTIMVVAGDMSGEKFKNLIANYMSQDRK